MYPLRVPYQPFERGVSIGWDSSLEMCREIFRDLEILWVQDFVLRSRPRQDAYGLTNPANFSRAIASVFRGAALPRISGGFTGTMEFIRLVMPVLSIDDIGVTIGMINTSVSGSGDVVFPSRGKFFRCVTNNSKHSNLTVTDHEDLKVVRISYYGYTKDGLWFSVLATFNRTAFFEAFDMKNNKVDFEKLNQNLMQSIVAGVKHDQRPTLMPSLLYPNRYCDNVGDHSMKSILTSHANGQAMMTVPVFFKASWSFYHDGTRLRQMLHRGITDRMQKIRLSPSQGAILSTGNLIMNEEVVDTNIAPRPTPTHDENGNEITSTSKPIYSFTKAELVKIRNREAAKRSYLKKRAAKRRQRS